MPDHQREKGKETRAGLVGLAATCGAAVAFWAEPGKERMGRAGKRKEKWVGPGTGFGLGFSFTVFPISISFLIQTTQTI